ncbi:glycosyltransferase family 2 protein [Novosphingobium soli]|uniref:Glycosyltransferase family 2 protein n=1 Tax=Novosphingobium soli TaxID=574956 RepID=A0ABV6CQW9_9SPHN
MSLPLVSILMVARNADAFIDEAIRSARAQTVSDFELIVVDDGSGDATRDIVRRHVSEDDRVHLRPGPQRGLSAVRNASLQAARGRYALILDSDDILHPRHVEGLLHGQKRHGAEVCATNMVEFAQRDRRVRTRIFADAPPWISERPVTAREFIRRGDIGQDISLGYLKPLLDLGFLARQGIRYDERLRIGEDFDLALRVMMAGGSYAYLPQPTYFYRRHPNSTSHRLTRDDLEGLIEATDRYRVLTGEAGLRALLEDRRYNLQGALLQLEALSAIKAGRLLDALQLVAGHPGARKLTARALSEAFVKRLPSPSAVRDGSRLAEHESVTDHLNALVDGLADPPRSQRLSRGHADPPGGDAAVTISRTRCAR